MKLYRVTIEETGSRQPGGHDASTWRTTAEYCGYDVHEARRVYWELAPTAYGGSPGNPQRLVNFEVMDTDDLGDDDPGNYWESVG